MKSFNNLFIAKFGQKEHLEALQNGYVFFNPISKFRDDGTKYRGDKNEGTIPIDPSSIRINGHDYSDIILSASKINENDGGLLMFCTAIINEKNLVMSDGDYIFSEDFKTEMIKFGDHVLLINIKEFEHNFTSKQKELSPLLAYRCDKIIYRNLSSFDDLKYNNPYNITNHVLDPYFVKSDEYVYQNEWRLIIGEGSEQKLKLNSDGSYILQLAPLKHSVLVETDQFLNTFTITPK